MESIMHCDVQARAASILEDLQRRTVIPEDDRLTALAPRRMLHLLELALTREPERVLEIGLGWGFSAAGIQSLGCVRRHVIVDVDVRSPRTSQGERNIGAVTTRPQSLEICWDDSHLILPRLCAINEQFDLVIIDGGHRFDDVFVDFHFVRRLIAPGGSVFFDDATWPAVRTVVSWIETNLPDQWRRLPIPTGVSIAAFEAQRVPDRRNWDHFIPFAVG
jgi:predicted O-methyltransferase YrrM